MSEVWKIGFPGGKRRRNLPPAPKGLCSVLHGYLADGYSAGLQIQEFNYLSLQGSENRGGQRGRPVRQECSSPAPLSP